MTHSCAARAFRKANLGWLSYASQIWLMNSNPISPLDLPSKQLSRTASLSYSTEYVLNCGSIMPLLTIHIFASWQYSSESVISTPSNENADCPWTTYGDSSRGEKYLLDCFEMKWSHTTLYGSYLHSRILPRRTWYIHAFLPHQRSSDHETRPFRYRHRVN